jgi:glutaredoxin 3
MSKVEIYTSPFCGYCHRAKKLLDGKGVEYQEISIFTVPGARDEMVDRAAGRHTVPQIFINGEGIGGCDELYELERHGELDAKLAADASA